MLPGLVAGMLLGWSLQATLLLAEVTYISSSGIVAKLVGDLGRSGHPETRTVLAVLVFEDLAMAVYLPVIGIVLAGAALWSGVGLVAAALAIVLLTLRLAARRGHVLSRMVHSPSDKALLLVTLGVGLVASVTKIASTWVGSASLARAARLRAGTALAARGEFSIVIAGLGVSAGVEPELGPLAAAFLLLTALSAPLVTRWVERATTPVAPSER